MIVGVGFVGTYDRALGQFQARILKTLMSASEVTAKENSSRYGRAGGEAFRKRCLMLI